MNGPNETNSPQSALLTPRTSLQNIGEKREKDEAEKDGHSFQAFGADGFTFLDFLDIINPLQHIPLISTAYRQLTGDEIDPGSRVAGGTLFGGPIGTVVALANVAIEERSGKDMGEHMVALFSDDDATGDEQGVMLANAPPADFVTDAGVKVEQLATTVSPITTNAEVLEWARRETGRTAGDDGQARVNTPPTGAVDIAANLEVLNWARREATLTRTAVQTADAATLDQRNAILQQASEDKQAALDTTSAMGRNQAQLAGATAPLGGWFSETMLLALARYDESAQLGKTKTERRVEETVNTSE